MTTVAQAHDCTEVGCDENSGCSVPVEGAPCGMPSTLRWIMNCPNCKSTVNAAICNEHSMAGQRMIVAGTYGFACAACGQHPVNYRIEGHPRADYGVVLAHAR